MNFYGLGYWELMDTPIAAFWLMLRNIDRLKAEADLRRLENTVMATAGAKEALTDYQKRLSAEIGLVALETPKLDREGLHALKALTKAE
ncbi:hypothetical protein [Azospirillum argentinense]|uniref:hypothetical protein n=1 Tax=Azospirillum argentinense TaxID=2970906 RepID=UPI0032DE8DB8